MKTGEQKKRTTEYKNTLTLVITFFTTQNYFETTYNRKNRLWTDGWQNIFHYIPPSERSLAICACNSVF